MASTVFLCVTKLVRLFMIYKLTTRAFCMGSRFARPVPAAPGLQLAGGSAPEPLAKSQHEHWLR